MGFVPVACRLGVDLQRYRQLNRRMRRFGHEVPDHGDGRFDFILGHFKYELVMHLQEHMCTKTGLDQSGVHLHHRAAM